MAPSRQSIENSSESSNDAQVSLGTAPQDTKLSLEAWQAKPPCHCHDKSANPLPGDITLALFGRSRDREREEVFEPHKSKFENDNRPDHTILYLLDFTSSMTEPLSDGTQKIDALRFALREAFKAAPAGVNLQEIAFGVGEGSNSCHLSTELMPLEYRRHKRLLGMAAVNRLEPTGNHEGMEDVLYKYGEPLKKIPDKTRIVLISDGEETCPQDPCGAIEKLQHENPNLEIDFIRIGHGGSRMDACVNEKANGTVKFVDTSADLTKAIVNTVQQQIFGRVLLKNGATSGKHLTTAQGNENNDTSDSSESDTPKTTYRGQGHTLHDVLTRTKLHALVSKCESDLDRSLDIAKDMSGHSLKDESEFKTLVNASGRSAAASEDTKDNLRQLSEDTCKLQQEVDSISATGDVAGLNEIWDQVQVEAEDISRASRAAYNPAKGNGLKDLAKAGEGLTEMLDNFDRITLSEESLPSKQLKDYIAPIETACKGLQQLVDTSDSGMSSRQLVKQVADLADQLSETADQIKADSKSPTALPEMSSARELAERLQAASDRLSVWTTTRDADKSTVQEELKTVLTEIDDLKR